MSLFLACVSSRSKTKKGPSKANAVATSSWPWDWVEGAEEQADVYEEECTTPSSLDSDEEEVGTPTAGAVATFLEPQVCGIRRDLTSTFQRLRTAGRSPVQHRRRHSSSGNNGSGARNNGGSSNNNNSSNSEAAVAVASSTSASSSCSRISVGSSTPSVVRSTEESLEEIFKQVYSAESSLSSRIAQHHGLVQFGSEFGGSRPPPLELRAALPEVELSIEERLEELKALLQRLQSLEVRSEGGRHAQVQQALAKRIEGCLQETEPDYEEQKRTLEKLQQRSPLLAPAISDDLLQSLSSKLASPNSSRAPSTVASPRTASPLPRALQGQPLPELSMLPFASLDGLGLGGHSLENPLGNPLGKLLGNSIRREAGAGSRLGLGLQEAILESSPNLLEAFQSQASFEMLITDWDA
mmetsp:Transcript_66026/g.143226  ORF Transcript_66026/g.143226 Transcript_66026/m.143226 type:complete len:411 (+) Transcript_66026:161-1393(+)